MIYEHEHEGIEQSCQICKKKSTELMTMNALVGGWYHPWQREDSKGYFFGIKCNDCWKDNPPKDYIEDERNVSSYEEFMDI